GLAAGAAGETRADLAAAELAVLQVADGPPGVVVPHHPDCGDVVLDRGAQHVRRHGEAAVADNRDARTLGRRELCTEYAGHTEAHGREAPGIEQRARPLRLPELHEPVVMRARVRYDDGVV